MPEEEEMQPKVGRTFWDFVSDNRRILGIGIAVISAIILIIWLFNNYPEETMETVREYWPLVFGPIAGWILGSMSVKYLYSVNRRVVFVMDVATHTVRFVSIPEKRFNLLRQTGNNVVYHTPYGTPVYIANGMDLRSGDIDYGWIHELNAVVVMEREEAYDNWNDTLTKVLEENVQLMSHPHVIGLGYVRKALKDHLDSIGQELGLTDTDLEAHDIIRDSVREENDDAKEGESHD